MKFLNNRIVIAVVNVIVIVAYAKGNIQDLKETIVQNMKNSKLENY